MSKISRYYFSSFWIILILQALGGLSAAETGQGKKRRIAILPITSNLPQDADAQYVAEIVRAELVAEKRYDVVANDQVDSQLRIIEKKQRVGPGSCTNKECAIDVGNALESELIFVGKLVRNSTGSILISGRIINVVTQKEEIAAFETAANGQKLEPACRALVQKLSAETDQALGTTTNALPDANCGDRCKNTLVRLGLGTGMATGDTIKTYYNIPISVTADLALYNRSVYRRNLALVFSGNFRWYTGSTSASGSTLATDSRLWVLGGGLGLRYNILPERAGAFLRPYLTVGAKFNYASQKVQVAGSASATEIFTGIGGIGGLGAEFSFNQSFGAFIEASFGYSPIGSSRENIDGWLFHGGVLFRR